MRVLHRHVVRNLNDAGFLALNGLKRIEVIPVIIPGERDEAKATLRCNMASENRPVYEVRLGRVKAAAFANDTERGVRYGVTFSKLYKDGDQWKSGSSFGRDDLPLLAKVADELHTQLYRPNGESQNGS